MRLKCGLVCQALHPDRYTACPASRAAPCQHLRRRYAVFAFIAKARQCAADRGYTRAARSRFCYASPCCQWLKGFSATKIRFCQRPFFAAGVIYLQMMEVKVIDSSPVERRILLAVLREVEDISPTVIRLRGVKTSRLISRDIHECAAHRCRSGDRRQYRHSGKPRVFRNQVNHIQTQAVHAAIAKNSHTFFSSARTTGFSRLRSACPGAKRCR